MNECWRNPPRKRSEVRVLAYHFFSIASGSTIMGSTVFYL